MPQIIPDVIPLKKLGQILKANILMNQKYRMWKQGARQKVIGICQEESGRASEKVGGANYGRW